MRPWLVLGSIGRKSLNQEISGSGMPLAAHSMVAVFVRSTTFSWGPMSILGKPNGNRSSGKTETICRKWTEMLFLVGGGGVWRRTEMRKCEILQQMHKLLVFLWPQRQAYAVNAFFPSSQMKPNTHSHTLSPLPPPSQLTSAGSWEVEILARTLEPLYPPASKQRVLPTAS